jgi:hypothetical protein
METVKTLYNLLQMNNKIPNHLTRFMYLKDVWGLEQTAIAKMEGVSQSFISRELINARKTVSRETFEKETKDIYEPEEILYIQNLPREIINDMQVLAFIENILGVKPIHPFFNILSTSEGVRMAALSSLGIQNKRLMELFKRNQTAVSMNVKRHMERAMNLERPNRYETVQRYVFSYQAPLYEPFKKAGGIE